MVRAFVELSVKAGKVKSVVGELRGLKSAVGSVCAVTGHCDIMATVELPTLDNLSSFLLEKIRRIEGVVRTESLVCVTDSEN